jgi:biotin carboxyl carrier protein
VYHFLVSDFAKRANALADLMSEFGLSEAELSGEDWKVAFRKQSLRLETGDSPLISHFNQPVQSAPVEAKAPPGTPISCPMTGIYYSAASPTSPPFVTVGERVEAGQIIALIEAMKVFNEVTATMAGIVQSTPLENGALVNLGEPLLFLS